VKFNWWSKATNSKKSTQAQRRSRPARPTFRPWTETLEDRVTPAVSFGPAQNLTTGGNGAAAVTPRDFNNDGRLDLAVTNNLGGNVAVLLGNGNGTFGAPIVTALPPGAMPVYLAAGFLNNDAFVDLAVTDNVTDSIYILLGTGTGTFNPGTTIVLPGTAPRGIDAGDISGDGLTDLAVALSGSDQVLTLRNLGSATFAQVFFFTGAGTAPEGLALADLTPGGGLDVAVALQGTDQVSTLVNLNNGTGGFTAGQTLNLAPGAGPFDVAAADLRKNGSLDLVVGNFNTGTVDTFLNNGSGTFAAVPFQTITLPAGAAATEVYPIDLNGDGAPDLVVTNFNSAGAGGVLVYENANNGTGNFLALTAAGTLTTGASPFDVGVADFNGDGLRDIASANFVGNNVSVFQNRSTPTYFAVGSDTGAPDQIRIFGSTGTQIGTFSPFGGGFTGGLRVATGDVTGDGIIDLVMTTGPGGRTLVFIYDGASIIANPNAPILFRSFFAFGNFSGGAFVAVGNLDGIGASEIILAADKGGGPQVNIYSNAQIQANSFATAAQAFFAYTPSFTGGVRVASADINGDGLADIVTGAGPGAGPQINVYLGALGPNFFVGAGQATPNPFRAFFGIFAPPGITFTGGTFVTAGDFDGDGRAEIIVAADQGGGPQVQVFTGANIVANNLTISSGGFNNIIVAAGNFFGGTRVGSTVGLYGGSFRRILISAAGPGGDQLTGFDIFAFLQNNTQQPPQFISQLIVNNGLPYPAFVS